MIWGLVMVILIWLEARLPGAVGEVGALWLIGLVATIVLARGKEKWQNGERWCAKRKAKARQTDLVPLGHSQPQAECPFQIPSA